MYYDRYPVGHLTKHCVCVDNLREKRNNLVTQSILLFSVAEGLQHAMKIN